MSEAEVLLAALRRRGWTLGVAESLTGGALSSEIVGVPGASECLLGAVVAYATPVKHTVLGVDDRVLRAHGPVYPLVAEQMADGVRRALAVDGRAADVGIATTGIAGPDSPDGQPVGTVHIGVVTPTARRTSSYLFVGDRAAIRRQAVETAIEVATDVILE